MKTILVVALVFAGSCSDLVAQERRTDALYLTGQVDSSASLSGGGGEVEWLHPVSPNTSVLLGGASASVEDLWWTYGTVAGFTRRDHVILSGRASVGSGRFGEDRFPYTRFLGAATIPLANGFYAEAEGQHVRILDIGTTVFRIGGTYAAVRDLSLRLTYNVSASSQTAQVRSLSGRADLNVGQVAMFGGMTTTGAAESIQLSALELSTHIPREFFAGTSFNAARSRLICAVQVVPRATGRFSRVTATLQLPLGSRPAPDAGVSQ